MINKLDRHDTQFVLLTIGTPLIIWWLMTGRKKYGTKGMK